MVSKSPKRQTGNPPIYKRLKPAISRRLNRVCKKHDKDRLEVAYDGLLAEIERLEAKIPHVSDRVSKAVIECNRLGVDVVHVLMEAATDHVNRTPPTDPASINAS